jgi:AraC-like DNA-binding protein
MRARHRRGRGVFSTSRISRLPNPQNIMSIVPTSLLEPLVSVAELRTVVAAAASIPFDLTPWLATRGVHSLEGPAQPASHSFATWAAAWNELSSRDVLVGLRASSTAAIPWESLDHLVASSARLGQALQSVERFVPLANHAVRYERVFVGKDVNLQLSTMGVKLPTAATEFMMGMWLRRLRACVGGDLGPITIRFAHPAAVDARTYEEAWGCRVMFSQSQTSLTLSSAALDLPMTRACAEVSRIMERELMRFDHASRDVYSLTDRIRAELTRSPRAQLPSLPQLARRMGLGSRTLQRRLNEAGTPYRDLLRSVRESCARELLASPDTTLVEVGAQLGFSDASAFHKAFRRWTGQTPGSYRATQLRRVESSPPLADEPATLDEPLRAAG